MIREDKILQAAEAVKRTTEQHAAADKVRAEFIEKSGRERNLIDATCAAAYEAKKAAERRLVEVAL